MDAYNFRDTNMTKNKRKLINSLILAAGFSYLDFIREGKNYAFINQKEITKTKQLLTALDYMEVRYSGINKDMDIEMQLKEQELFLCLTFD